MRTINKLINLYHQNKVKTKSINSSIQDIGVIDKSGTLTQFQQG